MTRAATLLVVATVLISGLACGDVARSADEWGNLTLTFRYDGDPPQPAKINVDKDTQARTEPLYDESLLVDPKTRGIANIAVYLHSKMPAERINWSGYPPKESSVPISTVKMQIQPHMLFLRTDQFLEVVNRDNVGHNPKMDVITNAQMCVMIPANKIHPERYPLPENLPVKVSCSIHPWEGAWIIIRDNPYCDISNQQGRVAIKNLPMGEWTFRIFHERAHTIDQASQDGKKISWEKSRLTVKIAPGENDLGTFDLSPALFARD